jgi:hypothetical protein
MRSSTTTLAVLAAVLGAAAPAARAANLVKNGSFEKPAIPAHSWVPFATGSTAIPHWRVIGPHDVAVVNAFAQGCCSFPAAKGSQFLDLTGSGGNSMAGIQQTVATVAGTSYTLSFAVGNVVDPTGAFGTTSKVQVLLNGSPLTTVTNGLGGTTLHWQTFSVRFRAATASTTLAFVNQDPATDNVNGLDTVKLVAG